MTWLLGWARMLTFHFYVLCMHQAIEGFALMVKKTAQTLQSFGTELAETELPNEIQATTILLSTHTNKKDKMKVTPSHITWSVSLYLYMPCCILCMLISIWISFCRKTCWWFWVRAAGYWTASMSPLSRTLTTIWTRTNWRTLLLCKGLNFRWKWTFNLSSFVSSY